MTNLEVDSVRRPTAHGFTMTSADAALFELVAFIIPLIEKLFKEKIKRLGPSVWNLWTQNKRLSDYVATVPPALKVFRDHVATIRADAHPSSTLLVSRIAHRLDSMFSKSILEGVEVNECSQG